MASNLSTPFLPSTRREFFRLSAKGVGLLAFSRYAPSFLVSSALAQAPAPEKDRRILVLVQLAGGNDGLNTLIPFEDPKYYALRPTLAIAREKVLPIAEGQGLNPACAALRGLLGEGKLAIVQNVGYPNPNHSHFRSSEIWETASSSDQFLATGWLGRYLDNACSGAPATDHDPLAVHVNTLNGLPETLMGAREHPTFGLSAYGAGRRDGEETRQLLEAGAGVLPGAPDDDASFLRHTLMDSLVTETKVQGALGAYKPMTAYPANAFAASLRNVAGLIAASLPTRVYFVTLSGFDTHYGQLGTQERLLETLSTGLAAFQKDLEAHRLDGQVATMTFSEFGRRPFENESKGTDHGTAAPLFLMGSGLKAGLHGTAPSLDLPKNADLAFSTDFRSIYASVLQNWLDCPSAPVLGQQFPILPLFA
ncbi:MAG TPA: DUF1501 domain-containing protein [Opitutaceae bacterium]|jgi:uncharacterized protein (DUF1501 family)|nr:DUF1501 domain-containing protein [Opitutaceae bacterium]